MNTSDININISIATMMGRFGIEVDSQLTEELWDASNIDSNIVAGFVNSNIHTSTGASSLTSNIHFHITSPPL